MWATTTIGSIAPWSSTMPSTPAGLGTSSTSFPVVTTGTTGPPMSRITCGSTTARSIRTGGADLRGEDIGQGHRAWNQSLLVEVADQALDRGPVRFQAVRIDGGAQQCGLLLEDVI